jgi:hypothetical protein
MKKALLASLVLMLAAGSLFAGGDKVRGDNGLGDVNQVQVQDPPPFEDPALSDPSDLLDWLWLLGLSDDLD